VAKDELENLFNNVLALLDRSLHAFNHQHLSEQEGKELGDLEEHIEDLTVECHDAHIIRLNRNECSTESGMLFMNTINDFERVADHAINIAFLTREAN
jgi:phosphate:Na+ symporter